MRKNHPWKSYNFCYCGRRQYINTKGGGNTPIVLVVSKQVVQCYTESSSCHVRSDNFCFNTRRQLLLAWAGNLITSFPFCLAKCALNPKTNTKRIQLHGLTRAQFWRYFELFVDSSHYHIKWRSWKHAKFQTQKHELFSCNGDTG